MFPTSLSIRCKYLFISNCHSSRGKRRPDRQPACFRWKCFCNAVCKQFALSYCHQLFILLSELRYRLPFLNFIKFKLRSFVFSGRTAKILKVSLKRPK